MSAFAVVTLDITAPVIEVERPVLIGTNQLVIPYSLNEGEVVEATIEPEGMDALSMMVFPDELRVALPDVTGNVIGRLMIRARDDVWNEIVYESEIPLWGGAAIVAARYLLDPELLPELMEDPVPHAQPEGQVVVDTDVMPDVDVNVEIEIDPEDDSEILE